jgi:glucosamine-6-phosphate deaminase
MFHLDEYIGLDENHPASFRNYLRERFVSKVKLKNAYFVDGNGNVEENIKKLTENLNVKPIDVGVIGIGENAHIAFNDPPADFETNESYKIVELDNKCKMQQVGEGWFENINSNIPATILKSHPNWTLFLDEESASLVKDII